MSNGDREAYAEMIELLQEAGYIVVDEEFASNCWDSEFHADLWIVPPPK